MGTIHPGISMPDLNAAELAHTSAGELTRLLKKMPAADRARVQLDGNDLILPRQALALLRDILTEMAQGNAVTIMPNHAILTTQEAANILNVSRPYLIKLLEQNQIPYSKTGSHRRIAYKDLMKYKDEQMVRSNNALDELAKQAQELDMGY